MSTRQFDTVTIGDEIAPLPLPLDRSFIVATAIATRDYQDVHHDPDLAQAKGSKDIFMNILTTNGLIGRYVTDWAGPDAMIKKVAIRLGAPNYPGDTMTLMGTVTAKDAAPHGGGTIEIAIVGANGLGNHVTGTVVLALPDSQTPTGGAS
ncbi:MAG: MaoC domain protein dehydratase [Acidimicrobiales bacterium]|nr:MaoC domain protein dehydratase [Acidimicrobiales bacterium]